jgi:hypothetical protein
MLKLTLRSLIPAVAFFFVVINKKYEANNQKLDDILPVSFFQHAVFLCLSYM